MAFTSILFNKGSQVIKVHTYVAFIIWCSERQDDEDLVKKKYSYGNKNGAQEKNVEAGEMLRQWKYIVSYSNHAFK